jgi:octaprenyl-diphosphate synthase
MTSASARFAEALTLVPEIRTVEDIIRSTFASDIPLMRDIPEYLLSLGGKRIRPVLTLLFAKATGTTSPTQSVLDISAGIELIHMATLMHDDIIDQSPIRRHKASPYAVYGTPFTLLSGDFLLTRAFGLCARLPREVIIATEQACIELVEGETLETALSIGEHSLETGLTVARRKTAALFRLAAYCPAFLANLSEVQQRAASAFGEALGVAFQIIDDILDVTSTEAVLGKLPGLDIAERKPSMINLLWLASGDPRAHILLTPPEPATGSKSVAECLELLSSSPVLEETKKIARDYAEIARSELSKAVPETNSETQTRALDALQAVIDFAIDRIA